MLYCMIFYTVFVDVYRKYILNNASIDFQICQGKKITNTQKNRDFCKNFYFLRKKNKKNIFEYQVFFYLYIK